MSTDHLGSFFTKYYSATTWPPQVPFTLQKGDRLHLIGDSITETRRYSRMLETYLAVCQPDLHVEVRNIGKGGETADGFHKRMDEECLNYQPTASTVCYGMNDAGYINDNREAADKFRPACEAIVRKLKAAGVRVVLGSPGCIGRLPPWDFVAEAKGTLDGLNTSLMYMRDHAAAVAGAEGLSFVDHFWNLYRSRLDSSDRFGPDYAVCGLDDGVHPSWAGHVVMAYGFFKELGLNGDLGTFTIDLPSKSATTDPGHTFKAEMNGTYTFTSHRYPFCAEGLPDKDWSIRSGMALVPFNQEFNRMTLKVIGTSASRYRIDWMNHQNLLEEWHAYTGSELAQGINLAEDFHLNPFTIPFNRIDDLINQKQSIESNETWHVWEQDGKSTVEGLVEQETQREQLLEAIRMTFVPVTHHIRIQEVS